MQQSQELRIEQELRAMELEQETKGCGWRTFGLPCELEPNVNNASAVLLSQYAELLR